VRHDPTLIQRPLPDKWELATSPSLIALQRNEPVYIRDARESEEFPGYRREAFERDYRTVLVMPMNCADSEGRPMVLSVIARQITEVSEDRSRLPRHDRASRCDRRQTATPAGNGETFVRPPAESLAGAYFAIGTRAGRRLCCFVVEHGRRPLAQSACRHRFHHQPGDPGRSPNLGQFEDAAWQEAAATTLRRPLMRAARDAIDHGSSETANLFLDDGTRRFTISARIEPLNVDAQLVGALIIFPSSREFSDLDLLMLDSAKFALNVQMMRSFIRFRFETRTQTELFFEVVEQRWRNASDVLQRAQRLGLNFTAAHQMIVVDFPERTKSLGGISIDVERSVAQILQQASMPASVIATDGGLICLVPFDVSKRQEKLNKVMRRIAEDLGRSFEEEPIVVASSRCNGLADYPAAWERCSRTIRIGHSFGRTGALSGQDFGPLPLLVAASDAGDIRGFVHDSVGTIAEHDRENGTPYLETLSTYLQEGCRSQACADTMGLHVTTLRYRMSRIQELFGIDVETPEKRFAVELRYGCMP
jgi:DNA-binding PucR family transcriptional regulator